MGRRRDRGVRFVASAGAFAMLPPAFSVRCSGWQRMPNGRRVWRSVAAPSVRRGLIFVRAAWRPLVVAFCSLGAHGSLSLCPEHTASCELRRLFPAVRRRSLAFAPCCMRDATCFEVAPKWLAITALDERGTARPCRRRSRRRSAHGPSACRARLWLRMPVGPQPLSSRGGAA